MLQLIVVQKEEQLSLMVNEDNEFTCEAALSGPQDMKVTFVSWFHGALSNSTNLYIQNIGNKGSRLISVSFK